MSKRSKVVLIIIISIVILTLFSFLNVEDTEALNLEEWEEEIVLPDNQLDPLNEKMNNTFIIDVALKIEDLISNFFDFLLSFFK